MRLTHTHTLALSKEEIFFSFLSCVSYYVSLDVIFCKFSLGPYYFPDSMLREKKKKNAATTEKHCMKIRKILSNLIYLCRSVFTKKIV